MAPERNEPMEAKAERGDRTGAQVPMRSTNKDA